MSLVDHARFLPDGRANIVGFGIESIELSKTWVEDGTGGLYYTKLPADLLRGRQGMLTDEDGLQTQEFGTSPGQCCSVM